MAVSLSLELSELNYKRKDTKQEGKHERRALCVKEHRKEKALTRKYLNIKLLAKVLPYFVQFGTRGKD